MSKPPLNASSSGEEREPAAAPEPEGGDLAPELAGQAQAGGAVQGPGANPWLEFDELGMICPPV